MVTARFTVLYTCPVTFIGICLSATLIKQLMRHCCQSVRRVQVAQFIFLPPLTLYKHVCKASAGNEAPTQ